MIDFDFTYLSTGNEMMAKSVAVSADNKYFVSLSEKGDNMSFSIKVK